MPIKSENRARYPADWPQIRERILERAGHKCEACGVGNHWWIVRIPPAFNWICVGFNERLAMRWPQDVVRSDIVDDFRIVEIVLTIAHLDHTPENCDPANLRAWCQRCHLRYDQQHHRQTRRAGRAIGDLFQGGA